LNNEASDFRDKTCVLLQAESYYLKAAFKKEVGKSIILSPVLNFSEGFKSARISMVEMAIKLGVSKPDAYSSFDFALNELNEMLNEFKDIGRRELELIEKDEDKFAVVLIGRAYNSYAKEANAGIPQKFSSRNVTIIPQDFLPYQDEKIIDHMYWGMGNQILKAGEFIKNHGQLYAAYITNFSCGPDSFLIGYFRDIMENKPSLTLELDSHSADAGINTRIEAFLDIVKCSREIDNDEGDDIDGDNFHPLEIVDGKIRDSSGTTVSVFDSSVKMIVPNMGRFAADSFSAAFRHAGINSQPLPVYTYDTVKTGRGSTTCKECLPLILTAGSMLEYCNKEKDPGEKTLFFMAGGDGPCRFGQYSVFLKELIRKQKLKNMGVYTLSDDNLYEGLGNNFDMRGYTALLTGDVYQNIYHAVNTMAADKKYALEVFENEWAGIIDALEKCDQDELYNRLKRSARNLSKIEKKFTYEDLPKVAVIGEIFVRNDEFSRVDLMNKLYERKIIPKVAPVTEYVHYSNYMIDKGLTTETYTLKEKLRFRIRKYVQLRIEKKIRSIMSESGFCDDEVTDVEQIIKRSEQLINPELAGEAILTVGTALHEIIFNVSGVISIGPFGCMPSRVAESILNMEMNIEGKESAEKKKIESVEEITNLPYLAIETDGNIFPQIIQSRIEIFMLQAERLHKELAESGAKEKLIQLVKFKKRFGDTIKGYYEELPDTFFDGDEKDIVTEND
jgi:predicted nucleotide-binding protein (sugar kinase/HSP70/actin superfamily)